VTLGDKADLARTSLVASQLNILDARLARGAEPVRCAAKIRYNHDPQPATAHVTAEGLLRVTFDEPQHAVTPGQAVVLYDGEAVLGGGWIDEAAA